MIPTMIVPVLNYDHIESMVASVDYPVDNLVIIDNGGAMYEFKKNNFIKHCWIISLPNNLGVATSWNLGIKSFPLSDWWMICNDDIVFPSGALRQIASMSSVSNLVLSGGGPLWCTFTIGSNIIERVGMFDESFYPAFYEDTDYQRRLLYHGIRPIHSDVYIEHVHSATAGQLKNKMLDYNKNRYKEKMVNEDFSEGNWKPSRIKDWTEGRL